MRFTPAAISVSIKISATVFFVIFLASLRFYLLCFRCTTPDPFMAAGRPVSSEAVREI
jgi:hypothetical protein